MDSKSRSSSRSTDGSFEKMSSVETSFDDINSSHVSINQSLLASCISLDESGFHDEHHDGQEECWQRRFAVQSYEWIVAQMEEEVDSFIQKVEVPRKIAKILLIKYEWDKQILLDEYFSDSIKLFEKANLINPSSALENSTGNATIECSICFYTSNNITNLQCGHKFCNECWTKYLTEEINEGTGHNLSCPGCYLIVDDETVKKLVTDADLISKYNKSIIDNFVRFQKKLTWCPSPGCNNAIETNSDFVFEVTCDCGTTFCFGCSEDSHSPAQCDCLKKWMLNDSNMGKYLSNHTKQCPKCCTTIEKNGGCNHMTCRNCRHEFCWVCLDNWNKHKDSYYCNRFRGQKESEKKSSKKSKHKETQDMETQERLKHYWERYESHMISMDKEKKQYGLEKCSKKIQSSNWQRGVHVLQDCRRTLMFSYVFVYYLKSNNQVVIFEDNQAHLENQTETLSVYLEHSMDTDLKSKTAVEDINQKLRDKIEYCAKRRNTLLKHVEEGYQTNAWQDRKDILS